MSPESVYYVCELLWFLLVDFLYSLLDTGLTALPYSIPPQSHIVNWSEFLQRYAAGVENQKIIHCVISKLRSLVNFDHVELAI